MMAANLAEIQMIAGHWAEQINKGMVTQTNTLEKFFSELSNEWRKPKPFT